MNTRSGPLFLIVSTLMAVFFGAGGASVQAGISSPIYFDAIYNTDKDVPLTSKGDFSVAGLTVRFTLNFAPVVGTELTLVKITSLASVTNGSFANLAHGQAVTLVYSGQSYNFVANYYGGDGNDIVLEWAGTRPMAWGNNGNGQQGRGNTSQSNAPVDVTSTGVLAGKTIISLSAGRNHSIALCSDGTVAAWGLNSTGQIGSSGGSQSTVPVLVGNLGVLSTKRVIAVAAGETHSLALCSDGTVAAWGSNTNGQLGNGSTATTGTPTPVSTTSVLSGKRVVAIAAGKVHSVALLSTGEVAAWGYNFNGQLGNASNTASTVPVLVSTSGVLSGKTVSAIAAGQNYCLALCSDGTLASWGENNNGQLGDGSTTDSNAPVTVTTTGTFLSGRTVTAIAAGAYHSLALCSDGKIASWGLSASGQLGRTSGSPLLPGGVSTTGALSGKTVTSIAGGVSHSLAQCSDGTLTAWGSNSFGEMGTGIDSPSSVPQNVSTTPLYAGQRFNGAASGPNASHSLAIVASLSPPNVLTTGTLISNGSFESGFSNWSVSDINGPFKTLQVRDDNFPPGFGLFSTAATDGHFSASSGFEGHGPGVIRLAHDVPVTSIEPFVRFDYRVGWDMLIGNSSTQARTFAVTIEPAGGGPVLQKTVIHTAAPHTKSLDSGPLTGSVDLTAYIGTTVRVCFDLIVPEDSTGPAFFQLDNVRTAALLPASTNPITSAATDITTQGATLNGIVNTSGLNATVEFEYGLTAGYGSVVTAAQSPLACVTDTAVTAALSELALNTTYHYRVKTTTSAGVKVGADKTFTTLPHAPAVSGLSSIFGVTSASLSALVNPDGSSTEVTFEYGLTDAYGSSTPAWETPITTSQTVHGQVSGIVAGVTYHYRVKATNAGGTTYSEDSLFEAVFPPMGSPTVTTQAPTMIDRVHATLNGNGHANGESATVDFEAGTTTHYNQVVSGFPSSLSGSTDTPFTGSLNQLTPGTTYHYRARGLGQNVYIYGPDVTFSTPAIGFPAASTAAATGITQTTATLNGYVSGNNGPPATVSFEYGLDTNYGSVSTAAGLVGSSGFTSKQAQIPVSGDSITYHYRIKAKNNIGTTYGQDMTFTTPDPHEAKLYGLALGTGQLSPAFNQFITSYSTSLPFKSASLTFAPEASTGIASVTINGVSVDSGATTAPIPLKIGNNVFSIVVTALDGVTTQTYTVNVTRAAPVPGDLDISFNGTGAAATDFGVYDRAVAVMVQSDGRILAAGTAQTGDYTDFGLARYNPDGSLDTSFGSAGKVTTDIGGFGDVGLGLALQSDGKIIVVGNTIIGSVTQFAVVRYLSNGTLDTSFNGTGKVTLPVGTGFSSACAVAVQSDGKIVVAGDADVADSHGFAVVRLHGDIATGTPGTLDTTFNGTGIVLTSPGVDADYAATMALQSDGKIVVGGSTATSNGFDSCLARYLPNGSLDASFNGGKFSLAVSTGDDSIHALTIQADGIIVTVGSAYNGTDLDFSILRLHGDSLTGTLGTLDTSFNLTGKILASFSDGDDVASGVVLQNDGKIVVSGRSGGAGAGSCVVARYDSAGHPDFSFYSGGSVIADLGDGSREVGGVALQNDGKIVVATALDSNWQDFSILRFLGDGPGIAVEVPENVALFDGLSTADFGDVVIGTTKTMVFTIKSTGTSSLNIPDMPAPPMGLIIDGADSDRFALTAYPSYSVQAGDSTTLAVTFTPGNTTGGRIAALHIDNNVPGSSPFAIQLSGTGALPPPAVMGLTYDMSFDFDGVTHMTGTLSTSQTGAFTTKAEIESFFNSSIFSIQSVASAAPVQTWNNTNASWSLQLQSLNEPGGQTANVTASPTGLAIHFATPNETSSAAIQLRQGASFNMWQVLSQQNNVLDQNLSILQYDSGAPGGYKSLTYGSTHTFPAIASVTAITGTSAVLRGQVNPNGYAATTRFIYGTDSNLLGGTLTNVQSIGSGTSLVATSSMLQGLQPQTTYYYRVSATSANGTTLGPIRSFTTTSLTTHESWREQFFGHADNQGDAADDADPNGNGIPNLLEYALSGDPSQGGLGGVVLPHPTGSGGNPLELNFSRYLDHNELVATVQASDSPAGPWVDLARSTGGAAFTVLAPGATVNETGTGNERSVVVGDLYPVTDPGHPRRFMRLQVTKP